MKQSVIFKTVLFAMVTLPLLTACTDDSNSSVGNVSNELKINVGIATAQKPEGIPTNSRVVNPKNATIYTWGSVDPEKTNPTSFPSDAHIGIFLRRAADEGPYGYVTWNTSGSNPVAQISGPYDNMRYTSRGDYHSKQIWEYATAPGRPTVLLPTGVYGKLCAYFPYDSISGLTYDGNSYNNIDASPYINGAPYTIDPTGAPSGTGRPAVSDLGNPGNGWLIDCSAGIDYMYCPAVGPVNGQYIDADRPVVNILMHHAQACLRFKVSVPASFSGIAKITRLKVYGGFAMKAYTDIWSPSTPTQSNYTVDMPETSPGSGQKATMDTIEVVANASSVLKTMTATSSYEAAFFCVPYNEAVPTNLYIECDIDGHTYRATISSITLLREWIYEIPLMLTDGQLIVNQVTINPWTIDSSIPVTPLL